MSDKFFSKLAALQDPNGVARDARQLHELQKKISTCVTRMFAKPENGGDPFMFALVSPKPHYLIRELGGRKVDTAATDGRSFFWNPEFLESLDVVPGSDHVGTVLKHEKRHIYLHHTSPERGFGWNPKLRNIAFDYIDNGGLEADHIKSGRVNKYPLFGGPLGEPLRIQQFLDWIDGKAELQEKQIYCYSDPEAIKRTADSIYHEIQSHVKRSPRRCKKEDGGCEALTIDPKTGKSKIPQPWSKDSCPKCGAKPDPSGEGGTGGLPRTLDTHIQSENGPTKDEIMADLMKAANFATQCRGTIPAEVEGLLKELREPTLSPHDIIVNCFQRRVRDVGDNKDYTRFIRRPQYIYEVNEAGEYVPMYRLYQPKNYDHTPKWACLVDTSGSMSEDNIADGVKELQIVASIADSEGYIVPCDSKVYWDRKIQVTSTADIHRTQVVGRGGTVLADFFRDLSKEIGNDLDLVVVVTDGWIDTIPAEYNPGCEVIFILTSGIENFQPPFGRAIKLYPGVAGT